MIRKQTLAIATLRDFLVICTVNLPISPVLIDLINLYRFSIVEFYRSLAGIRYYYLPEQVNNEDEAKKRCEAHNMQVANNYDNTINLTELGNVYNQTFTSDTFCRSGSCDDSHSDLLCEST